MKASPVLTRKPPKGNMASIEFFYRFSLRSISVRLSSFDNSDVTRLNLFRLKFSVTSCVKAAIVLPPAYDIAAPFEYTQARAIR
jgi:hypothetical protein